MPTRESGTRSIKGSSAGGKVLVAVASASLLAFVARDITLQWPSVPCRPFPRRGRLCSGEVDPGVMEPNLPGLYVKGSATLVQRALTVGAGCCGWCALSAVGMSRLRDNACWPTMAPTRFPFKSTCPLAISFHIFPPASAHLRFHSLHPRLSAPHIPTSPTLCSLLHLASVKPYAAVVDPLQAWPVAIWARLYLVRASSRVRANSPFRASSPARASSRVCVGTRPPACAALAPGPRRFPCAGHRHPIAGRTERREELAWALLAVSCAGGLGREACEGAEAVEASALERGGL